MFNDLTKALRKKYFDLLSGNISIDGNPVPVYYKYLPNSINTPYYIVIRNVSNSDTSTKQSRNSDTTIDIGIYTKDTTANSGSFADDIADQIKQIIIPGIHSTIDLQPEFSVTVLQLQNDFSPDALQTDNAIFINRFLTFSHKVLHHAVI